MLPVEIDVEELERRLSGGAQVFDVREPDEWATSHIAETELVPLNTVPDRVASFPRETPIYILCAKGGRSAQAVEFLRAHGIEAVNVSGGMGAWLDAGKPTVSGASSPR